MEEDGGGGRLRRVGDKEGKRERWFVLRDIMII